MHFINNSNSINNKMTTLTPLVVRKMKNYVDAVDFEAEGAITNMIQMKQRLETEEETQKREKNRKKNGLKNGLKKCLIMYLI